MPAANAPSARPEPIRVLHIITHLAIGGAGGEAIL